MYKGGYQIRDQHAIYFITFTVVQWIDVFTRTEYCDVLLDALAYCRLNKNLRIHSYCIMSNHIHLICSSVEPNKLSDTIRDYKQFTSKELFKAIKDHPKESRKNWMLWLFMSSGQSNKRNKYHQIWQQTNHPIHCHNQNILDSRLRYVHQNPVKRKLVARAEDYVYSSARDYATGCQTGKLVIDFV